MSKKVLIITTSHAVLGATGYPTGVWLAEVAHPYAVLEKAGHHVEIASVKGGRVPIDPYSDPRNEQATVKDDPVSLEFLNNEAKMHQLNNSIPVASVDPSKYDAVIVSGGNGAVFDLANNSSIASIINALLDRPEPVVSTLCHGGAALLGVNRNNQPLVKGLEITCFNNEEEAIAQKAVGTEYLPFYLETELTKAGANFKKSTPFASFAVSTLGGRLITGQNNFSGEIVGHKVVEYLASH